MWDAETIINDEQVVADQLPCPLRVEIAMNIQPSTPISSPSAPVQRRLQSPPTKSKFLAVLRTAPIRSWAPFHL